jgi:transcriptional regulator with PAS, ATPase and Fis domain
VRNAHQGTLFLDEIGDLPFSLQAKLLRLLEQGEVQTLGVSAPVVVDVRVVAAAQESLKQAVREGRFRADLFARLETMSIRLPALRERREDIPYLFARMLLEKYGGRPPAVEAKLVERLCLYDWPFNVRELTRLVERLAVLHGADSSLRASFLPEHFGERRRGVGARDEPSSPAPRNAGSREKSALTDYEALLEALRASSGNVTKAADSLGISRQRAYRMMRERPEIDLASLRDEGV